MSMSYAGPGDDGTALATAQQAAVQAEDARQMVLRRDPKLNTAATEAATATSNYAAIAAQQKQLADLAASYQAALTASVADRTALHDAADALAARVKALEDRQPAFGSQATTALALLAIKDYVVTLSRPMPTATYTARVFVDPAAAGKLGATVTGQTTTTVTVRTTALVAVGVTSFAVVAWT